MQTKIKCKLVIFGLPHRKDVSFDVINNINKQIEEFCLFKNLEFVKTSHLFDMNRDYDDHVHLSQTGYEKWYATSLLITLNVLTFFKGTNFFKKE